MLKRQDAVHVPGILLHLRSYFPFVIRGDDQHRATGGAGLGLAIARQIADQHDAAFDVVGIPGRGSTFTLRLPVAGSP
jgi:signal transduction histidine kinase